MTSPRISTRCIWRFAECEYDEFRHELRIRGTPVELESKPLEVLRELLLHPGEVVTKTELLDSVWPGLAVVEGSLATAVSKLRKALGDGVVATVPRVGYRLDVPVHTLTSGVLETSRLELRAGEPVPGRANWCLRHRLDASPSSEVWLAERTTGRALRVFKFASDAPGLTGLKREVTLARLLRESTGGHPAFVHFVDWNFEHPPYFIESEYEGTNLAEWAEREGGLEAVAPGLRFQLLRDTAQAVAKAHNLGILHKDLKPANILVRSRADGGWQVRLADFGAASLARPDQLRALGITNLGFTGALQDNYRLSGTVMYMAPELLAGESPTPSSDVYSLAVILYQLAAGDFRKPLANGWEADVSDVSIRELIRDAAWGDPGRRLSNAQDFADRLESEPPPKPAPPVADRPLLRCLLRFRRHWAGAAALLAVFVAVVLAVYRNPTNSTPAIKSVAVLPFENAGSDAELAYLRLALADEVTNTLSQMKGIVVRPFAMTSHYNQTKTTSARAAAELSVDAVISGRYIRAGDELHITLEATDASGQKVLWHDRIDSPAKNLLATQAQIVLRVHGALGPALGAFAAHPLPQPKNEEGYALFLRSAALPMDPGPNAQALAMLENAVQLDPGYAPAWLALARRYYVEARYATGNAGLMKRYEAALERGVAVAPQYVPAAAGLIISRVERGDLANAYRQAVELVRTRPDGVDAHFALSYVLRFAGQLSEAAEHCEQAFLLDSRTQTSGLRSCAFVFLLSRDFPRAMNYVQLGGVTEWAKALKIEMLVREGKAQEALALGSPKMPQWKSYDMLLACLAKKPRSAVRTLAAGVQVSEDPEANYLSAGHLAYCGESGAALAMLKRAIAGGYCSYPAMLTDPMFSQLRPVGEFHTVRTAAIACRNTFLSQRPQ